MINNLIIILLSIVEGLSEFLPISSTGHMIIVNSLINYEKYFSKSFMNNFLIIVQLGAIIAVVYYFFDEIYPFKKSRVEFMRISNLWVKIIVALIPTFVIGLLLDDIISEFFLDNIYVVVSSLIFYAIILIIIEIYHAKYGNKQINDSSKISYLSAFCVGLFQCLAMVPGTSRSGATIIAGLLLGFSRELATEFSFYLAIPTMFGATALKVYKMGFNFTFYEWTFILIGLIVSFMTALLCISWFINFIRRKNFIPFAVYRIILAIIVLILVRL